MSEIDARKVGPLLVVAVGGMDHMTVLIWTFAVLYLLAAVVSYALRGQEDNRVEGDAVSVGDLTRESC